MPYAWGGPLGQARFKTVPDDFEVTEDLGFMPEGAGEHLFVWIEKRGANSLWVRRQLAKWAQVDEAAVGHSGLKDRHAVTRQWFSIQLPLKTELDWQGFSHPEFQILQACRHRQKLKPGSHRGNGFKIRLRQVQGDRAAIEQRLEQIRAQGCPNYFGLQRFGHQGNSLKPPRGGDRKARALFDSAWRSGFFNRLLAIRVQQQSWNQLLAGELVSLNGTNSFFALPDVTEAEQRRCQQGDIHPSGPLPGRGRQPERAAGELEAALATLAPDIWLKLEQRQQAARRPLRVLPFNLNWCWLESDLQLEFWLPPGAYATTVLREALELIEVEHEDSAE